MGYGGKSGRLEQKDGQIHSVSLELIDVSKRLNPKFALVKITLTIRPGEFFCLLGPSGSGKTTVLGVIGGWVIPDSGRLLIGAQDYTKSAGFKRPVRTCFQKGAYLFPHLTVTENIAYALRVKGLEASPIKRRVRDLMNQVGLDGLDYRRPSELSGGEAQRVAIARALADLQPVLLLDEIQTGLDRQLRTAIRELLVDLTEKLGITTIYVTHDASDALGLASRLNSRVGVLNKGRVEQVGSATQIYREPKSSFVASFLGEVNLLQVRESLVSQVVTDGGNVFEVEVPHNIKPKFLGIRPEAIALEETKGAATVLRGKVEALEFLGGVAKAVVRIENDLLSVQIQGELASLKVGDSVSCHFKSSNMILLEE